MSAGFKKTMVFFHDMHTKYGIGEGEEPKPIYSELVEEWRDFLGILSKMARSTGAYASEMLEFRKLLKAYSTGGIEALKAVPID